MSYFRKSTAPSITYYHTKCGQFLQRTMTSFDLAKHALAQSDPQSFAADHKGLFDSNLPTQEKIPRMQKVLIKSHFLLLKVQLELFLHLLGLECWRVALVEYRYGGKKLSKSAWKQLEKPNARELLDHNDSVEALCATAVPIHGLKEITDSMKVVGTDLQKLIEQHDEDIWSQVFTAFQVRHLIEHRNGNIDHRFFSSVKQTWQSSSWGRRVKDLYKETKVTLTEDDLRETAKQMNRFVESLQDLCSQLAERRKTLLDKGLSN
jgi:hypothetical protein